MVEIPDDVAKRIAIQARAIETNLRSEQQTSRADFLASVADLLDPQPPTLREQVARAVCADGWDTCHIKDFHEQDADAVLAVVADWLAAQPLTNQLAGSFRHAEQNQRDHDVRLIRGGSDG